MAKSWIKLTKSGVPFGLAHFAGDVVEVEADTLKRIMSEGGGVPAEVNEIEAVKAAIAAQAEKDARHKAMNPSNADLLAEIERLRKQLADKK